MRLGTQADLSVALQGMGFSGRLNTAFIERVNLTIRHGIAALARRTGRRRSSPYSFWPTWSGGARTIILCGLTPRFEWRWCSRENERANDWRNAIGSGPQRWQLAEPIDDGRRAKCSLAPCRRFPLERHRSRWGSVSCRGQMGEGTRRRAWMEPHSGKKRPVWTASSPKTGPKWVCRGLVDLSTISNRSTSHCSYRRPLFDFLLHRLITVLWLNRNRYLASHF